jgi:hypothetical protein
MKLDPKTFKCVFVEYGKPLEIKGYWFYYLDTHKNNNNHYVVFSKDVIILRGIHCFP